MSTAGTYPWWTGPATVLAAASIRAMGATWRIEKIDMEERDRRVEGGEGCIFAFWHSRILSLAFAHRNRGAAVLISRHKDGELIARVVQRLGFVTARGSSTRGGGEGMREMLSYAEQGHILAVTPDGPRGPKEQVKPGLVHLASRLGWSIVPAAAAASSEWRLNSWDGFRVPKPFARVCVAYGAPIDVPEALGGNDVPAWQAHVTSAISTLTSELQNRVGRPESGAAEMQS